MFFSSSHIWMWELDHKERWALKSWYFQSVVLEKTLESPLDYKEIQPVHPKGNQSWVIIGRTDFEAEGSSNTLATWCEKLTHWKRSWCWEILKAGGEGATEEEMVGWHHWLNRHEFEQTPRDSEGEGNLACCSPWGYKESDTQTRMSDETTTAWLENYESNHYDYLGLYFMILVQV